MCTIEGKTAIITGAAGGIGAAVTKRLHAQGAKLVISGTRQEKLDALKKELGAGDEITAITCNLGDKEAVKDFAAAAQEALGGKVDIVVNNAGITKDGLAMRMSDEDWQSVLDVNLTSSFVLIRSLLRGMMKAKSGAIVNISSIVGVMGNPGQANYVASKAGLIGMTKALAQEVASRGITVNAVAPGFIATPMTEALNDAQKEALYAKIPMERFGTPEDIASAVEFLVSDNASYITGQTLHINGGMVMV